MIIILLFKKEVKEENKPKLPILKESKTKEVEVKTEKTVQPETTFKVEKLETPVLPEFKNASEIDVRYPLIKPFVNVHIYWSPESKNLVYELEEPELNEKEKKLLRILESGLEELISLSFLALKTEEAVIEYLEKSVKVLLNELNLNVNKEVFLKLMYYIWRNFVGLNEIEPMMRDYYIEDIECNGLNTPIYIVHRKYRNLESNVEFKEVKSLTSFVEKLAQKSGKYISYASPILDSALPDGSVEYNEPFIYKYKGIIKIEKIGKFVDRYYKKNKTNLPVSIFDVEVPIFDNNCKIIWKPISYVYRHKNKEKLLKLKLETGREITLTKGHSLFILNNKGISNIQTKDIKLGDFTIIPTKLPETEPIKEINLIPYFVKWKFKNKTVLKNIPNYIYKEKVVDIKKYLKLNYKKPNQSFYDLKSKNILPISLYYLLSDKELRNTKISVTSHHGIPTILKIDKTLIRLLGYYTAEGWTTRIKNHHRIYFCFNSKEKEYINEVCEAFEKCFDVKAYIEKEIKNAKKIVVNSVIIKHIFEKILNVTKFAKNKQVPWIIYNVSDDLKREYIKTWSNGDYNCSASRKLMSDLSYLSLFNNKVMSINYRQKESMIEGRNILGGEYYSNEIIRNPTKRYVEMIPMELFNPLNQMHHRFSNKRISKSRLKRLLIDNRFYKLYNLNTKLPKQFFIEWSKRGFIKDGNLTLKGMKALNEKLVLDKLIESDLGFAKVKEISEVDSDYEFVYDVSVPYHENFISGFGGVFCHNSRVNATYTQEISSRGPTFTIRKFTKEPWSPIKLMEFKTVSPEILAYLWLLVENETNIMVIGGTGTGKTSFLNAIAFFIPPGARVVSIEDTKELMLKHENWLPSVARKGLGAGTEAGQGEVTLFDLLRASFRQRPDYVIVGEVRGAEASVLFQGMSSGHPSYGTMHAEDVGTMIRRLETPPISLSPALVESLDAVCIMTQTKIKGKLVRRLRAISEIIKVSDKMGEVQTNMPFMWDPRTDKFYFKLNSYVLQKIIIRSGLSQQELINEFKKRSKLLMALYKNKIVDFQEVYDIITAYYKNPEEVLKRFNIS